METALKSYILPDNMDGYTNIGSLIYDLEQECESEEANGNGLIAEEDLPALKHMWKKAPADFVEIIAVEWVSTFEDKQLLEGKQ